MIYIYDILVNLSNTLYEFYEWNKNDDIVHIKKMPLIRVDSKIINDLYNYNIRVDKDFLDMILYKTDKYDFKKIKYLACFSDGKRCIVLEFNDKFEVKKRSKLLLDDEEEVNNYILKTDIYKLNYKKLDKINDKELLTRKECKIRDMLIKDIDKSYKDNDISKLEYLYYEYFDKKKVDIDVMYNELRNSFNNFNNKHLNLYNVLMLEKN